MHLQMGPWLFQRHSFRFPVTLANVPWTWISPSFAQPPFKECGRLEEICVPGLVMLFLRVSGYTLSIWSINKVYHSKRSGSLNFFFKLRLCLCYYILGFSVSENYQWITRSEENNSEPDYTVKRTGLLESFWKNLSTCSLSKQWQKYCMINV